MIIKRLLAYLVVVLAPFVAGVNVAYLYPSPHYEASLWKVGICIAMTIIVVGWLECDAAREKP